MNNNQRNARGLRRALKPTAAAGLVLALMAGGGLVVAELVTSDLQARHFTRYSQQLRFWVEPGASGAIRYPQAGPFDERLGYSRLPGFLERLAAQDFMLEFQARFSPELIELTESGYFPPYREKTQAGLTILDCGGDPLFSARYPQRVYAGFETIPPLVVDTLLFIENRELLDPDHPHRNPAVEWSRLGRALASRAVKWVDSDLHAPGGSTLATQIEKYRHSPEGITASSQEKLRQMVSASMRAYLGGEVTLPARRQIVVDYLNTVPLAAAPGYGEVNGLGDGLWAWFGADLARVNELLARPAASDPQLAEQGQALRQVLALMIAHRRPSDLLGPGRARLERLVDAHLRLLAGEGVITPALRDAALAARLDFRPPLEASDAAPGGPNKAANLVRTRLSGLLDTPLYALDRLDLSVQSTLDRRLQEAVTEALRRLNDPQAARAAGLMEPRLLAKGDPRRVLYSFTLFERSGGANRVLVQTDNSDQPLDLNEGTKLEAGSTAKLRTLVTYLEIVAALHQRYAELSPVELRKLRVDREDRLGRWAVDYLLNASDKTLPAMLEAALERRYPASPAERFFTGGGVHRFENFKREEDSRVPTVREAFRDSVNLVFVRLMRDIVHHYMYQVPGSTARILEDPSDPQRAEYLGRFADREGRVFIQRFYRKYQGETPEQALELLLEDVRPSAGRLAVIFRSVRAEAGFDEFSAFLSAHLQSTPPEHALSTLYERHAPGRYSLADRGFLARVHPLELWLVSHLQQHPQASLAEVIEASGAERREVYGWLFKTRQKDAQDERILTLLEVEAFLEIHKQWKRLGYPFDHLVPSYATAIGSSADRPAALAELMGIIANDGLRLPTVRLERLHFAARTPYDTALARKPERAEQVLAPEIAAVLRRALTGVVESGTARRLAGAFAYEDGTRLVVGGKTGTGDNRFETYRPGGQVLESQAINRTATFVFFLGERHFGTLTALVPGREADRYNFTSALPVQILKTLAPQLKPHLDPRQPPRCTRGERVRLAGTGAPLETR